MKVVLYFRIKEVRWTVGDDELRAVQARYPQVEFVRVTEESDLPAALADADVFFGFHFPPELFGGAHRLRWIHSAAAGVEANLFPAMVASNVVLTNASGLHAVNIPEHALGMLCALARWRLPAARGQPPRRAGRGRHRPRPGAPRTGPRHARAGHAPPARAAHRGHRRRRRAGRTA
jgi:phosphoglycerate dehydrogenase-like enzyme